MENIILGKKIIQTQMFLESGERVPATLVRLINVTLDVTRGSAKTLQPGDVIQVRGTSKGKGFAGVVKRHHFKGGPRTHGQSDRERAPGSIGQTTTPGRVYRGKRMAGRMGGDRVTIKNLIVLDATRDMVTIRGLVPGARNNRLVLTKTGEAKNFVSLYKHSLPSDEVKHSLPSDEVKHSLPSDEVKEGGPPSPEATVGK